MLEPTRIKQIKVIATGKVIDSNYFVWHEEGDNPAQGRRIKHERITVAIDDAEEIPAGTLIEIGSETRKITAAYPSISIGLYLAELQNV